MVDPNRTPPRRAGVRSAMPEPRAESFAALREDGALDVIVVGGGINGIGVFRELALQGLRVLLVERNESITLLGPGHRPGRHLAEAVERT